MFVIKYHRVAGYVVSLKILYSMNFLACYFYMKITYMLEVFYTCICVSLTLQAHGLVCASTLAQNFLWFQGHVNYWDETWAHLLKCPQTNLDKVLVSGMWMVNVSSNWASCNQKNIVFSFAQLNFNAPYEFNYICKCCF